MKKKVLFLAYFCFFIGAVTAQKDLTSAQKSFQSSIISFLREEGYSPSIDSDGWIAFKSEGKNFWITIEAESPFFVTFRRSGFKLGGDDGFQSSASMMACNSVNKKLRAVKMYCTESSVYLQVEQYTRDAEDFKYVFYKNLSVLADAAKKFVEEYNEFK